MARNNPPEHCAVDEDPPEAMLDTGSDGVSHGGQDPDDHPDQGPQPNPDAPGPGNQKGQQPVELANMIKMQGEFPPDLIKRQECQRLPHRIGFFLDMAQAKVCNHGYNTAKKVSRLKPDDVDIFHKTIHSPGGERKDGTQDPDINFPYLAQHPLTSMYIVLHHRERCDLHPMLNTNTHKNVYDLDLQCACKIEHNNDHYRKDWPNWNEKDSKKSFIDIYKYIKTIHGTSKAPCLYMLHQHIVSLVHKNLAYGYSNSDKTMIERCPIIPIKQHVIYANRVGTELLEDMYDLRSPKYLLDSAMSYAKLKIIMQNTSTKTCIDKFCKTHDVNAVYKKLRLKFLGPGFIERHAGQLEDEL